MRALLGGSIGLVLALSAGLADEASLAGSLWLCTRVVDRSQFVITFYPGGGVGGGEVQDGEVNPYVFDASRTKDGEWPRHWDQKGQSFTWSFPDQHMEITGTVSAPRRSGAMLMGKEVGLVLRSALACTPLSRLPKIGEGLVIPQDGHFIDPNRGEGQLKVPAGVSLQQGQ